MNNINLIIYQRFDKLGNNFVIKNNLLYKFIGFSDTVLFTGLFEENFESKKWYISGEKINCSSQEEFNRILDLKCFL